MNKIHNTMVIFGILKELRTQRIREHHYEHLQTIFTLEWLAHNNINIQVIDDVDQLWLVITKDYNLYTTSSHMHNMSTSTLQTVKDFLVELDSK